MAKAWLQKAKMAWFDNFPALESWTISLGYGCRGQ